MYARWVGRQGGGAVRGKQTHKNQRTHALLFNAFPRWLESTHANALACTHKHTRVCVSRVCVCVLASIQIIHIIYYMHVHIYIYLYMRIYECVPVVRCFFSCCLLNWFYGLSGANKPTTPTNRASMCVCVSVCKCECDCGCVRAAAAAAPFGLGDRGTKLVLSPLAAVAVGLVYCGRRRAWARRVCSVVGLRCCV